MTGGWQSKGVETVFWIVAGVESFFLVAGFVKLAVGPASSKFDGYIMVFFF